MAAQSMNAPSQAETMANLMKIVLDLTVRVGELETEIKTLRKPTTPQTPTSETETKTLRKPIIPPTPISSAKMTKGDTILYDASRKAQPNPPEREHIVFIQTLHKQGVNKADIAKQTFDKFPILLSGRGKNTPESRMEQVESTVGFHTSRHAPIL